MPFCRESKLLFLFLSLILTMDFVTVCTLDGGLNGLMVCVEKLTKLTRLISCFVGEGAVQHPKLLSGFLLILCNYLVYHARLFIIGTLDVHLLSGSHCLPL